MSCGYGTGLTALDPENNLVSVLITPDGKLVTVANPLPVAAAPANEGALQLTADNKVQVA